MNKILIFCFSSIFLFASVIFSQSIYLKNNKLACSLGFGYAKNNLENEISNYDSYLYHFSTSILSTIDIGIQYSKIDHYPKVNQSITYSLDLFINKEPFGVVLNTAFNKINTETNVLFGLSIYKVSDFEHSYFANSLIPVLSIGIILPDNLVYGFSIAIEFCKASDGNGQIE